MAIKFKIDEEKEALKKEYEAKGEKAPKKLKIKKPKRQRLALITLIITALITLVMIAYVALPLLSIVFGVLGFTLYGLIILVPTIVTIGLIWLNVGWRTWTVNFANNLSNFFTAGGYVASKMIPAFPYVASFGGAIIIGNLIFEIYIKKHPDLKETNTNTRFMLSIILVALYIIFLIVDTVLITSGAYN